MENKVNDTSYEAKILSKDGKILKIFQDKESLEKINQCNHITALYHQTKNIITEVEESFLPLKPYASSLLIETRGGQVIVTMSLDDFFAMLELAKRIVIKDRFQDEEAENSISAISLVKDINEIVENLKKNS